MKSLSPSIIDGIDSLVDIPVEKDEAVEKAVKQFIETLDGTTQNYTLAYLQSVYKHYLSLSLPALDGVQINLVLQRLLNIKYKFDIKYKSICFSSAYISALIQKSYDVGHNGFVLQTQNVPWDYLCAYVEGSEKRPLDMNVYGDTKDFTGCGVSWCSFKHEGDAGDDYFDDADHVKIFLSGALRETPLANAMNITFKITDKKIFDHAKVTIKKYDSFFHRHLMLLDPAGKTLDEWDDSMNKNRVAP